MTKSMQLTYGTIFFFGACRSLHQVVPSELGTWRFEQALGGLWWQICLCPASWWDRLACWNWHPIFESRVVCTQKMPWNQTKNLLQLMLRFSVVPPLFAKEWKQQQHQSPTTTSTSTSTTSTFHTPIPFHVPEISSAPPARCLFTLCAGPGKEVRVFDGRTEGKIVEARHVWNLVTWDLANFFDDLMHRHGCFFNCVTLTLIFAESFAS